MTSKDLSIVSIKTDPSVVRISNETQALVWDGSLKVQVDLPDSCFSGRG